ncbi:MAG: D-glycero-beta-D-manno-heptose-7-phosphate kinase [Bacteroidetes bacterium]|nr:D-glycero-beta-D-manno-heptose-7-phosphate kinase [Bacteroidota bacterium]MBL0015406.1 D-glycero-beta-D-manno-heptose-7-phosphate kinase [Bacteroidota bacterium]
MIASADIATFEKALPGLKVLVIGDLMLDRYHFGRVTRISPEAPVPVVDVERTENRPGGAANVALNIRSLGAAVTLCGVIGNDDHGDLLIKSLAVQGLDASLVITTSDRPTTTKTRIIGNNQQILRVDHESREAIGKQLEEELIHSLGKRIQEFDAIILEDYDKGLLGPDLIEAVVQLANAAQVPVVVDPKYRNFLAYKGVTLFKPNLKELNEALNHRISKADLPGIQAAVMELREKMPHRQTLVTLSENGVLAIDENGLATHLPAHLRKIADVSGAGDTVIAVMALALAAGLPLKTASEIANLAGGLVCEEVGVVPIDLGTLLREMKN